MQEALLHVFVEFLGCCGVFVGFLPRINMLALSFLPLLA